MKIQSIQSYSYANRKQSQQNSTNSIPSNTKNQIANSTPSFGIGAISGALAHTAESRLNILELSERELVDLAESFHQCPDPVLRRVSERYKGWFFTTLDKEKTDMAYTKLKGAINEVLKRKKVATDLEQADLNLKAYKCYNEYELWFFAINKDMTLQGRL